MNIRSMYFLDYWAGRLLCFFLSILGLLLKPLSVMRRQAQTPQKILLIKFPELGAIVLAYPLLKELKNKYPQAEFSFLTFKKNRDIFKLLDGIIPEKNILLINEDNPWLFLADTLKVIVRMWRRRFDTVLDLEFFSRFSSILTFFSGAQKKIGFSAYTFEGLYRGNYYTHKILYNPLSHISRNYLCLAEAINKQSKNSTQIEHSFDGINLTFPGYRSQDSARKKILAKLAKAQLRSDAKIFLLNPGEGILPLREWPLDNFQRLAGMILEDKNNRLILVGTQQASKKARIISDFLKDPCCINLAGQTSLEELMELFLVADALICNDCGLAHLAMLGPIKKFVIFGPESPQIFAPLGENNRIIYAGWPCSPCLSAFNHRRSACRDNLCLKNISPKQVYETIRAAV